MSTVPTIPVDWRSSGNPLEEAARRHNMENNVTPSRLVSHALGLTCPRCPGESDSPLLQNPTNGIITCPNNHSYPSLEDLKSFNPQSLKNPPPARQTVQANQAKMEITLPIELRDRLAARFKERLGQNVAALLHAMAQEGTFIVSEEDAKRVSEVAGEKIKDGSKLYGIIFSLNAAKAQAEEDARNTRAKLSAAVGGRPITTGLELDDATTAGLNQKAENAGKTPAQYIREAVINNWI